MIGYRLQRQHQGNRWLFLGTTPDEIARAIKSELEMDMSSDLPADELEELRIVPVEISQEELDTMPDFEGW